MPIFLDTSKRRKFYFRGVTAFFLFALLGSILLFFFGLSFATSTREPISYTSASERYHYYYSAANDKKIAITIDDGPYAPASEKILSTLELYNAPATFFYIGEHVLMRPDLVQDAVKRGFDVQAHSFTHGQGVHDSYQRLSFELHSTGYLISQFTGKKPEFYRPPFLLGIGVDPTVNPYIKPPEDVLWSLEMGYLPVGSDIDPKDWLATTTPEILAGLEKALHDNPNGHILLLHEDVNTAKAIGHIVTYLRDKGYSIVPLKELVTPPIETALSKTLVFGDTDKTTNGEVSKLQWFLYKEKYLDPYQLTGVFDEATKLALTNFQVRNNLIGENNFDPKVVGVVGPTTRSLIQKISATSAASSSSIALIQKENIVERVGGVAITALRGAYVHAFPALHSFLILMIFFSLLLVVGRSLGLIGLLLYGKFKQKKTPTLITANHPGVSILIPAYNEQQNIAATVESVIRTSYPNREIIVIDDGSQDNTSGEVESVIRMYPHDQVSLVRLENGGKARALNKGLEYAKHDIVVVLDADAVLEKDAISHFIKHFIDPRVGAVAGKVCTTGNSRLLDLFQTLEYAMGQNIDKRAFSQIGAVGVVPGPAGAWRKSLLRELGGFSTDTLAEDQDMTLTILRSGNKIIYEPLAIAYTETPHTIKNFLKQRFRWVYGTMQCFWKHKGAYKEKEGSVLTLVVLPNIFIFNIILPLIYPFADSALLMGLFFGDYRSLVLPFLLFTAVDVMYAVWGVWKEPNAWKLMLAVPLQRIVYRQLLYYSVMKGVVRAFEGTGSSWNTFVKMGETKRFFFTSIVAPVPSTISSTAVPALPEANAQREPAVAVSLQTAPVAEVPTWSSNMLAGVFEEPRSYEKSASIVGPTT